VAAARLRPADDQFRPRKLCRRWAFPRSGWWRAFDDPTANLRVVLTPADTRDKVAQSELRQATLLTAALVAAGLQRRSGRKPRKWRLK